MATGVTQAEVDLLTARIDDLTRFLVEATTKRDDLAAENAELKAGREDAQFLHGEMRRLRELAGELLSLVKKRAFISDIAEDSEAKMLLAKAKALGIGGEG